MQYRILYWILKHQKDISGNPNKVFSLGNSNILVFTSYL